MNVDFVKMHGLGNDFIVIDDRPAKLKKLSHIAQKLCNRRFGIGADQMLLLAHSDKADFRMRIFNADGSEVEMCGNGIRCLGKFIWDRILKVSDKKQKFSPDRLSIETLAGIIYVQKAGKLIKVDMGEPVLEPANIPVNLNKAKGRRQKSGIEMHDADLIINYPLDISGKKFRITCVSIGNPHAVTVVKDLETAPVKSYGPFIEHHELFPNRTNVEFLQITNQNNIKVRVWERGAGETMACGTGAAASAVASSLLGLTGRKINVHLPGGKLTIHWSIRDNHVYMTGPAEEVFVGTIEV